jgi:thioredoxin 1
MRQITAAQFDSEVMGSKEPIVVDFYTDDCPPCRALSPILQEWEQEANNAFKVVKVDAAAEATLASQYGVRSVPTVLLFSGGRCLAQTIGLKSKKDLKKWFDDGLRTGV